MGRLQKWLVVWNIRRHMKAGIILVEGGFHNGARTRMGYKTSILHRVQGHTDPLLHWEKRGRPWSQRPSFVQGFPWLASQGALTYYFRSSSYKQSCAAESLLHLPKPLKGFLGRLHLYMAINYIRLLWSMEIFLKIAKPWPIKNTERGR